MTSFLLKRDASDPGVRGPVMRFVPEADITAYELARVLPFMLGAMLDEAELERLPANVRRHLSLVR